MRSMTKVGAVAALATAALFGATAANAANIPNPQGVLLDTVVATIPANPDTLSLLDSSEWTTANGNGDEQGFLNGDPSCGLEGASPDRVYTALTLHIVKAGHYTFRIVGTNPEFAGDIAGSPIQDPYLALYEGFDINDLDAGVVGCSDDAATSLGTPWENGDTFLSNGESNTNDRWSVFEADLDPGNYTVILTTWAPVTLSDWAQFAPESATFEYWGPECGIEGATCSLADTGVDTTPTLIAGFGFLAAGIAAVKLRRRLVK